MSKDLICLHYTLFFYRGYGLCQRGAPFRWGRMINILAAGSYYLAVSILRDVLNRLRAGLWQVPQAVSNIFCLSIENCTNNYQGIIFSLKTYFYIGEQEASVSGDVGSSDIEQFRQHLSQTGHDLKGLYLSRCNPSPIPGKYMRSLRSPFFLQNFLRNQPQGEPLSSIPALQPTSQG